MEDAASDTHALVALDRASPVLPYSAPTLADRFIELELIRIEQSMARIRSLREPAALWPETAPAPARNVVVLRRPAPIGSRRLRPGVVGALAGAAVAGLFQLAASYGLFEPAPKAETASLSSPAPAPATPIAYLPFLPSTGAWDRVFNVPQRAPQVAALPVATSDQPQARGSANTLPESYARSIDSGLVESWSEGGTEKFVLAGPALAGAKGCRNFLVWENGGGLGTAATIRKCATGAGLTREP